MLTSEDLIALYLLEHPEDEDGFLAAQVDGEALQGVKVDVLARLGRGGVAREYCDPELVEAFSTAVERRQRLMQE